MREKGRDAEKRNDAVKNHIKPPEGRTRLCQTSIELEQVIKAYVGKSISIQQIEFHLQ